MPLPLLPVVAAGSSLLIRFLSVAFIVGLVARIMAALGFAYFSFKGIDVAVDALQAGINNSLGGMSYDAKQLLDISGVTTIITWIINAFGFRLFIKTSKAVMFRKKSFT